MKRYVKYVMVLSLLVFSFSITSFNPKEAEAIAWYNCYSKTYHYEVTGALSIVQILFTSTSHCAHTYNKYQRIDGTWASYHENGGSSGGSYLTATSSPRTWQNSMDRARYASIATACDINYGFNGVCHQEADRGLYWYKNKAWVCYAKCFDKTSGHFGAYGGGWTDCQNYINNKCNGTAGC